MNKKIIITAMLLIFSTIITLIDAFIPINYFLKIPIKIFFFFIVPVLFLIKNKEDLNNLKKLFIFKKKGLIKSLLIGLGIYSLIIGGYFLTKNIIDFSNITANLTSNAGITSKNFIYVSLYISFFNSFLEEFFFRGLGFITLKEYTPRKNAYLTSSIIFAIYHIGMLINMFNFPILILLLIGLIVGGCIFNYLNEKNKNIYTSWFVHMFANFAINTIGFILFNTP